MLSNEPGGREKMDQDGVVPADDSIVTKPTGPEGPAPALAPVADNGLVLLGESELAASRGPEQTGTAGGVVLDGSASEVSASESSASSERATEAIEDGSASETNNVAANNQDSDPQSEIVSESGPVSESDAGSETDGDNEETSAFKSLMEWLTVLVGAVIVALVFRAFLFQAFFIPSESMENTLNVDDRVMVNKLSYKFHGVNRGDVVVFHKPEGLVSDVDELIKRVMALEGETIEGRDNAVWVNGQRVAEPYIDSSDSIFDFGPYTVPEDHVFVMGDNRDDSHDSRIFNAIPEDSIVGRAFVIFWPLGRIDAL